MKNILFLTLIYLALRVHSMNTDNKPANPAERNVVLDQETGQLFFYGNDGPSNTCDRNCKDESHLCHLPMFSNACKSSFGIIFALKCKKTCGLCKPCDYSAGVCSDNCVDAQPQKCLIMAPTYCKGGMWSNTVKKYCAKSCGVCIDCNGLKPVPDCEEDCHDEDRQCRSWANEKKYCEPDSRYRQWMLNNCKQSCGVCRNCDGEAPPGYTKPTRPSYTTRRPYTTPPHHGGHNDDFMCRKSNRRGGSLAEECLAAHNYYRCLHGVEDFEYDYRLEDSAKAYANTRPNRPSRPSDLDRDVGENWIVFDSVRDGIEEAVAAWYAEGLDYDYQMRELVQPETRRFTQLIWSDTTNIGCAERRYNSKTYIVVHYHRAGNDESVAFSNIFEPILDVCSAKDCEAGYCQGHDNSHDCECVENRRTRETVPRCYGNCVVKCPQPRFNRDDWVESCEGTHQCTCITEGSGVLGARCT